MKSLAVIASACALLTTVGCVSQETYDKKRAETDELTRALDMARIDVKELDQRIEVLQSLNKKEDAVTAEIRAAIQREMEAAPVMRRQADDRIATLQTQVAHLVNQSRQLGRDIAAAKQDGASLQALVTQYKGELEESRPLSLPMPAIQPVQPAVPPAPAPVVPAPITQAAPPQPAQTDLTPPVKPAATARPLKAEPAQPDESWTGMIKGWVSSLWDWIFG